MSKRQLIMILTTAAAIGGCNGETDRAGKELPKAGLRPSTQQPMPSEGTRPGVDAADESPFLDAAKESVSTFSVDVDTASYALSRQHIRAGILPDAGIVRTEEFINYFDYDYPAPEGELPLAVHVDTASAPWQPEHRLVRIGLKAKDLRTGEARPAANLVFLIDVSGSMAGAGKLPLLRDALRLLVEQLTEADRVAIVTYAGTSGVALEPTAGNEREKILAAIDALAPGGSTDGAAGIKTAYELAGLGFKAEGINRVLLCTDGDFNVGETDAKALVELIKKRAEGNVFLTTLGFGMTANDGMMETLADHGNGVYGYVDSLDEARRILGEQSRSALMAVAKDVKVQVTFAPEMVARFRLIGYENRSMTNEDFADDAKDAGDVGAGDDVTALYEVILKPDAQASAEAPIELVSVGVRYKEPLDGTSQLIETTGHDRGATLDEASVDLRFAAAVALFAMRLRGSKHIGEASFAAVRELAETSKGEDVGGWRTEFLELVAAAEALARK